MWCLVVFQHDCMPSTFPKVKKSYSWETSSVSKEEVVYLRPPALYSYWIARSKYYGGITKQMNYNYPRRWNQWKHWVKWHQRGSKGDRLHIFWDILAWNVANKLLQFARRSWTPLLRLSSPRRRTGKLRKTLSLLWKISLPSSGIQELKNS